MIFGDTIKIGAHIWKVKPDAERLRVNNLHGEVSFECLEIYYDETLPEALQEETILHEINHIILRDWLSTDLDEEDVGRQARAWLMVMRDNEIDFSVGGAQGGNSDAIIWVRDKQICRA